MWCTLTVNGCVDDVEKISVMIFKSLSNIQLSVKLYVKSRLTIDQGFMLSIPCLVSLFYFFQSE